MHKLPEEILRQLRGGPLDGTKYAMVTTPENYEMGYVVMELANGEAVIYLFADKEPFENDGESAEIQYFDYKLTLPAAEVETWIRAQRVSSRASDANPRHNHAPQSRKLFRVMRGGPIDGNRHELPATPANFDTGYVVGTIDESDNPDEAMIYLLADTQFDGDTVTQFFDYYQSMHKDDARDFVKRDTARHRN